MGKVFVDLYTLQANVREGLSGLFPEKLWLKAEISSMKARANGHCYLELSQSADGRLLAQARAIIWANKFRFLSAFFESVTGNRLTEGMTVLVQVQVNYSELYGFSLIIDDIDPEYTLGEKEAEKQRTIERLTREGLMDRQKQLSLAPLPYRLAVISSATGAGYRDFERHLHENEYGFVLCSDLFAAAVQGDDAPAAIIRAMNDALAAKDPYDAILILRGGGGKIDLACYDDYALAAAIARCPVPVFTAVGHDQDFHVCDMVSYCYVKTPTALADEFLSYYEAEDERISSFGNRLRTAFLNKIAVMNSKVDLLEARIKGADPRNILKRGYVLAVDAKGRPLRSVSGAQKGDSIGVMFADGTLECEVKKWRISNIQRQLPN